eukprot:5783599-Lingulodinium_polyedra.AAC.2
MKSWQTPPRRMSILSTSLLNWRPSATFKAATDSLSAFPNSASLSIPAYRYKARHLYVEGDFTMETDSICPQGPRSLRSH